MAGPKCNFASLRKLEGKIVHFGVKKKMLSLFFAYTAWKRKTGILSGKFQYNFHGRLILLTIENY